MADFADLDRRLGALNANLREVPWLLARVLGPDRSRERLEQLLTQLASAPPISVGEARPAGFWPRTVPPPAPEAPAPEVAAVVAVAAMAAAAAAPAAEVVVAVAPAAELAAAEPVAAEPAAAPEVAAPVPVSSAGDDDAAGDETDDSDSDDEPELALSAAPSSPPDAEPEAAGESEFPAVADVPAAPPQGPGAFAALFDLSEPPPPRISFASAALPAAAPVDDDTHVSPAPDAAPAVAPPPAEDTAVRRARVNALLDQDLDPNDFPSNPPRPLSRPPQVAVPPAAAVPEVEEDFELLVDDDEILELDEGELEIVDE